MNAVPRRVGILGGTFDPIHLGHLIVAEESRAALGLDRVLFVPVRRSPLKSHAPAAPDADRAAMVALAIADHRAFALHRADLDRPAPSYTVDTLALVQAELGPAVALWLIIGSDALAGFAAWRAPDAVVRAARLAVVERPGYAWNVRDLTTVAPGIDDRVDAVSAPQIGISATDLRRRVADGRSIRYQVPAAVEAYIDAHALYRA